MRIYKFVRTDSWQLCLAEFDVKEGCQVNDKGNDTVDAETILLLHTYLWINNEWQEVDYIKKVYSIIKLHNTNLATFEKGKWVCSENPTCGFHAFTTKSAPYFSAYQKHFEEQLNLTKPTSYELPLPSLELHYRY